MSTRRALGVAAIALLATGALGGCEAGRGSMTSVEYSLVTGVQVQIGSMALRDVYIVPASGSTIAQGGTAYLHMTVVNDGVSSDELTGISLRGATATVLAGPPVATPSPLSPLPSAHQQFPSPGASAATFPAQNTPKPSSSVKLAGPEGYPATTPPSPKPVNTPVTIAAGQVVQFGTGSSSGPQILLSGFSAKLLSGQQLTVTFTFRDAGSLAAKIPISPVTGTTATATPVPTSS